MDHGIKVTQAGYNVDTTDETKYILKTNSNLLKVKMSGATTFTGSSMVSVTHSLGYVPQFLVYIEDISTAGKMNLATAAYNFGIAKADTTKVYFFAPESTGTYDVYYYIFYEQA